MNSQRPQLNAPDSESAPTAQADQHELLDLWFDMPLAERDEAFADTAHTAELFGLSQRTIQLWISRGRIRAVPIGRKRHVWLDSVRDYLAQELHKSSGPKTSA